MRTIRAHTDQHLAVAAEIELEPGPARHLARVLRLGVGDAVVLFNGDGAEYDGTICAVEGKDQCRVTLTGRRQPVVESPLTVTLIQAIGRGEKMDWCIQKAVELGVSRIQPVFSERTEVRLSDARAHKRRVHWQQVAIAACEQSGRVRVPDVHAPLPLQSLIDESLIDKSDLRLFLDPRASLTIGSLDLTGSERISLVIGPEGGLSDGETARLADQGFVGIRLGPRILRTETAGLAALAALQAIHGDSR